MSTELIAIISVGVTVVGLLLTIEHRLRKEMRDEFKTQRAETQAEFKTQREITTNLLGRVARVEGLLEGLRESFTSRRADAVAEDPEEYDPRRAGAESKLTGSE